LVHNGIIENFKSLRDELIARGRVFTSQTDTEVVAHLVSEKVEAGETPQQAVASVLKRLHGAFALAILFRQYPDLLIGARLGSPWWSAMARARPISVRTRSRWRR
jgi:glucosamine--fructose-6-phosphate aminotransferase (isomerizing)